MANSDSGSPKHSIAQVALNAIADWVNKYRYSVGLAHELGQCEPDEVAQIARDLGVPANQMHELARKGPHSADLLGKMLVALHVDPDRLSRTDPLAMRDLQRLCTTCTDKSRCAQELASGTAAETFEHFCPNAFTLDALFTQKARTSQP